ALDEVIASIVAAYDANYKTIETFRDQLWVALSSSDELAAHVHSMKTRLKGRDELEGKLRRKAEECEAAGTPFHVTPNNLLERVNDLAGVRLLHLYTRQIREIDAALREIFAEQKYELIEGPFARTWDDESRVFFQECGIETQESPTLYTSVHYVIG